MPHPLPAIEGREASSLGERLWHALGDNGLGREPTEVSRAYWDRVANRFLSTLTYTEKAGLPEAMLSSVLLEALKLALAEYEQHGVVSERELLGRIREAIALAENASRSQPSGAHAPRDAAGLNSEPSAQGG